MLEFQQIKEQYPENLQRFERLILREYLQYKILQAIFDSKHASKLAFLGGTALRIVYGNTRFSEERKEHITAICGFPNYSMMRVFLLFLERSS